MQIPSQIEEEEWEENPPDNEVEDAIRELAELKEKVWQCASVMVYFILIDQVNNVDRHLPAD